MRSGYFQSKNQDVKSRDFFQALDEKFYGCMKSPIFDFFDRLLESFSIFFSENYPAKSEITLQLKTQVVIFSLK